MSIVNCGISSPKLGSVNDGNDGSSGRDGNVIPIEGGNGIAGRLSSGRLNDRPGIFGRLGRDGRLGNVIPIAGGNGIEGKLNVGSETDTDNEGSAGNDGKEGNVIPMAGGNGMLGSAGMGCLSSFSNITAFDVNAFVFVTRVDTFFPHIFALCFTNDALNERAGLRLYIDGGTGGGPAGTSFAISSDVM